MAQSIGRFDLQAREWVGELPDPAAVEAALAQHPALIAPASLDDREMLAARLLDRFSSTQNWREERIAAWLLDVAEALEDCPAHDLPIIASIRSCPWRGDFPPTAMQVSEWAQGRAFAIEAKRARMEQALKEHARRAQDQARPQIGSAEWTAQRAELEAVLNDFKRKFPSNRKDNGAT